MKRPRLFGTDLSTLRTQVRRPMTKTRAKATIAMLTGLLIDPFKGEIVAIEVASHADTWRKQLKCTTLNVVCVTRFKRGSLDIWVDNEGPLRGQLLPYFSVYKSPNSGGKQINLGGYGLVLAADGSGGTFSLPASYRPEDFAQMTRLTFERWKDRLDPNEHIDELLRIVELELPGRFRLR
jgi:hypothetical protein